MITASEFFSRSPADLPHDVEDAFFSALRNRNKTFKRTSRGRLAGLDRRVVQILKERGAPPAEVLDVGISSGATTLDLQAALADAGYHPCITGTDFELRAELVRLWQNVYALVGPDRQPLQVSIGQLTIRPWRRRLDWLTGMWAVRPLLLRWARRRLAEISSGSPVLLVSPRVRDHSSISLVEDNVVVRRDEFLGRFDFIRAANILNRDYFVEDQLQEALGNLRSYLAGPGALLLIVRHLNNGEEHGTLFEVTREGSLRALERFGSGSEVETLALAD